MIFNFRYSKFASPFILVALCISLNACQKPSVPEEIKSQIQEQQQVSQVTPDLDAICHNLKKNMAEMSAQRTTFALEQINRNIRLCLPLVSVKEQKHLMTLSDQMYRDFLTVDRTPAQQRAFDQYAFDQSQFPTIHQRHIEQLHIRDQYLLRHKGQAYIELSDPHQNKTAYHRNALYLAKVFAPYFPEAEKVFMVELGHQNQEATFRKNTLLITPQEIARRALFWENYVKQYPQSPFKRDAEYLLAAYTSFLFIGLADSPVSIHYEGSFDIQASSLSEIEQIATLENSPLAVKAQRFLQFIQLPNEQRSRVTGQTDSTLEQLQQYLKITAFDFTTRPPRDCFSDAICR